MNGDNKNRDSIKCKVRRKDGGILLIKYCKYIMFKLTLWDIIKV